MKIFLSSTCDGSPCAQIETNLLGTKYEVVLDRTVQPFAQHQATHSHTPLPMYEKLPSMQSMHSMPSASCEFDVPVVDLPSTSQMQAGSAASSSAEADLEPSFPVSVAESRGIAESDLEDDNQSDRRASMSSPRRFLSRFRSASHSRSEQFLQSPFATVTEGPDHVRHFGASLPPSGPASPTSPSFLARYQSAKESFVASRSSSGVSYPQTPSNSPKTSPSFPASFPSRSQSARVGNSRQLQGSCGDPTCSCQVVPKSVGGVQYKTRIRGFMRPRR